ncbi:hypothetical protein A2291_03555 [candidate division WOR-1 bacterium RIFOXYB2_FULL_42_35]|uniref:Response regulatory domain-containing protein n=1 Tax=candidate division WOR-1 bacterium RIFOXYC2_FULL_41_25 TaxID=1802586 RepID=A0A1F4TQG7_UNCSA|nr:MAG: hypothetical protein A2247_03125 [candidate division WOR-1 bacterium RIFOXYA2_FULL_41_14]OGC25540.1 MAG: hypothetical protein A2291_03555 [candidate division WOR-1 bacterium RIFOXYB2_FULL_42_35]OGC34972.1 MAG: hypothetical protein A2462_05185 [candidate division WOR-1 bacterium RIFOXYC2_FULL_41_25]OGC41515.1 MAG: hypothetical protein A2548_01400 [candidate division WOR-1 bacterium RIFOXYD2_FULL_41_8]
MAISWEKVLGKIYRGGDWVTKRLIGDHSHLGWSRAAALGGHGRQVQGREVIPPQPERRLGDLVVEPMAMMGGFSDGAASGLAAKGVVLFVDDQPNARKIAQASLRRAGYEVVLASSRQEALEILGRDGWRIDVLVTDIKMEEDDAGIKLIADTREQNPKIKVVAITGFSAQAVAISATNAGADKYIEKDASYIGEVVKAVDSLREEQRVQLAEIGALIYGLKDYLGNMITSPKSGLRIVVDNLAQGGFSVEVVSRLINGAIRQVDRIATTITQLGELIQVKTPLSLREINVSEYLPATLELGPKTKFRNGGSTSVIAHIDANVFVRAIQLFLAPAEKAVKALQQGEVTISVGQEADRTIIRIVDNGRREEDLTLQRLAALPFVYGKTFLYEDYLAMSLGLKFIRDHGGDVSITSNKETGTIVTIRLPLSQEGR